METQNIVNSLNGTDNENSKYATKKWYLIDIKQKVLIHPMMKLHF